MIITLILFISILLLFLKKRKNREFIKPNYILNGYNCRKCKSELEGGDDYYYPYRYSKNLCKSCERDKKLKLIENKKFNINLDEIEYKKIYYKIPIICTTCSISLALIGLVITQNLNFFINSLNCISIVFLYINYISVTKIK